VIIYERRIVKVAVCDGCRAGLQDKGLPANVNFGLLKSSFGFGSRLDDIGHPNEWHLCEDCWEKALAAVGLKPSGSDEAQP
jgi:hypothetical protein